MVCVSQRKLLPPLDRHISDCKPPISDCKPPTDLAPALVALLDVFLLEPSQPHSDNALGLTGCIVD